MFSPNFDVICVFNQSTDIQQNGIYLNFIFIAMTSSNSCDPTVYSDNNISIPVSVVYTVQKLCL